MCLAVNYRPIGMKPAVAKRWKRNAHIERQFSCLCPNQRKRHNHQSDQDSAGHGSLKVERVRWLVSNARRQAIADLIVLDILPNGPSVVGVAREVYSFDLFVPVRHHYPAY